MIRHAPLHPFDIQFARVPLAAVGSQGTPYTRWVRCGMPKLGQDAPVMKAVMFLYPTKDDAEKGVAAGGTGFLTAIPFKTHPEYSHIHAITNYHVAVLSNKAPPSPVVRINKSDGTSEVFEFDPSEWVFTPNGPDIAISPPLAINRDHDAKYFDDGWYLTSEDEVAEEVGPGEDVFMIGRFVDYDGVQTNKPAARFGHISMMDVRIPQTEKYSGRSIVLDMHSRSGFSGSPVFVYRTLGSHFLEIPKGKILSGAGHYIKLLGIHWAQFPEKWQIKEQSTKPDEIETSALKADSHYIEGLSGMTCVVPASDILALLHGEELTAIREARENFFNPLIEKVKAAQAGAPKSEGAATVEALPASDGDSKHQENFTALLNAAAQKQK